MKDIYSMFVEYSLMMCHKEDYADKQKLKAHNAATTSLDGIYEEMKQNNALHILSELLKHEANAVKLNAAAYCLKAGLYCDEATTVLKKIAKSSDDKTLQFAAKMLFSQKTY